MLIYIFQGYTTLKYIFLNEIILKTKRFRGQNDVRVSNNNKKQRFTISHNTVGKDTKPVKYYLIQKKYKYMSKVNRINKLKTLLYKKR